MSLLSSKSCEVYRDTVYMDPEFYPYFKNATPGNELGRLNIGSRPASRKQGGIESLRAIPWIFAWTQTRLHLPVWLGIGEALEAAFGAGHVGLVQEMYQSWPFFQGILDLVEMVLAKADDKISSYYERTLADPALWPLGNKLRDMLSSTQASILTVVRRASLLEGGMQGSNMSTPNLDEKIRLRAPYTAPLNILQALSLKALREVQGQAQGPEYNPQDPEVLDLLARDPRKDPSTSPFVSATDDCLMITIKGIAAGMQNTG